MKRVKAVTSSLVVLAFVVAGGIAASAQVIPVAVGYPQPSPAIYGITAPANECVAVLSVSTAGEVLQVDWSFVAADATAFAAPPTSVGGQQVVPFFLYYAPATAVGNGCGMTNPPTPANVLTDATLAPRLWLDVTVGITPPAVFIGVTQLVTILQNSSSVCVGVSGAGCNGGNNLAAVLNAIKVNVGNLTIYNNAGFGGAATFDFPMKQSAHLLADLTWCNANNYSPGAYIAGSGMEEICTPVGEP